MKTKSLLSRKMQLAFGAVLALLLVAGVVSAFRGFDTSASQLLAKRYKGRLDSDADEFIAYAVDGSNRMQGLIQDLLAYSRAGTNGKVLHEISSENALKEALPNLRATMKESGAVVTHDSLPAIKTDDMQLAQVFQNLVGNAIKYRSAEVPHVHVSATKNRGNEWVYFWLSVVKLPHEARS